MSNEDRRTRAIRLDPQQRRAIVETFFARHPGIPVGTFGLGQAILDFQAWEANSGRITHAGGSDWWRLVNGMMVLDIEDANRSKGGPPGVCAWQAYAESPTQARLWEAHQLSLHAGIRVAGDLLESETRDEQAFAQVVVDVVDRTALANRPTETGDLAAMTKRFYPAVYPVEPGALAGLELMRERTASRLVDASGERFGDVGLASSRWTGD